MPQDLRVIAYDTIVAGARRQFLREATIDMEKLAGELAISRGTLYRAVDSRDRLLGDVLWSLAERTYEEARRDVSSRGIDAIIAISHRFTESVMTAAPFRRFLETEPQTALRVLLTPAGGVHARTVALQREIFAEAFEGSGELCRAISTASRTSTCGFASRSCMQTFSAAGAPIPRWRSGRYALFSRPPEIGVSTSRTETSGASGP
jgi:AcrR family transcriptional regulator